MNKRKKIKVIDSVFFNGEIDFLLFRFKELNDSVDLFIVLESLLDLNGNEKPSVFKQNKDIFSDWENKIIHIKTSIPSESEIIQVLQQHQLSKLNSINGFNDTFRIKQLHDLVQSLTPLDLSFDDIIMVSNIDEIPVLPEIDLLLSYLSFEPVLFSQKDFIWTTDFVKLENHLGTSCFSYSQIITSSVLFTLHISKSRQSKIELTPINLGYRFSYFIPSEEAINQLSLHHDVDTVKRVVEDSRNNLVYYNMTTLSDKRPLKKYDGELPKHIHMLSSQKIGRTTPKHHLVTFNIDSLHSTSENFDSILIIKPSDDISKPSVGPSSENTEIHFIYIPNKKYYDVFVEENTLESFQKMYFFNESKKILQTKLPLDIDVFTFIHKGKEMSYSWGEIKNRFIYDLLN